MAAKDKLIQRLKQSHQEIEQLMNHVDHSLEIFPGWSMREILPHFTGWNDAVIASHTSQATGRVPTMVAEGAHNIHNAATVLKREALSFVLVYQERQNTHEQLKIAIRDLPPEKNGSTICLSLGADRKYRQLGCWPHNLTRSEPYERYLGITFVGI